MSSVCGKAANSSWVKSFCVNVFGTFVSPKKQEKSLYEPLIIADAYDGIGSATSIKPSPPMLDRGQACFDASYKQVLQSKLSACDNLDDTYNLLIENLPFVATMSHISINPYRHQKYFKSYYYLKIFDRFLDMIAEHAKNLSSFYLQEFDLKKYPSLSKKFFSIVARLPNLQTLSLTRCTYLDKDFKILAQAVNVGSPVRKLELIRNNCKDSKIEVEVNILAVLKLFTPSLKNCDISFGDGCLYTKELVLCKSNNPEMISYFCENIHFVNPRSVVLSQRNQYRPTDIISLIRSLRQLTNLQELVLSRGDIIEPFAYWLLTEIFAGPFRLKNENLQNLQKLDLACVSMRHLWVLLHSLVDCKHLSSLKLSLHAHTSQDNLKKLANVIVKHMPALQELTLDCRQLTDKSMQVFFDAIGNIATTVDVRIVDTPFA